MNKYESYKQEIEARTAELKAVFADFKSKYPKPMRGIPDDQYYMLDIPNGWVNIVTDVMDAFEKSILDVEVLQVKEKFGKLCIHWKLNNEIGSMKRLISVCLYHIEKMSEFTCQECGSEDSVKTNNFSGMVATLCPKCSENLVAQGRPIINE